MRTQSLLFGGFLAGALLFSTNANAFFWLLAPAARQPAAVQVQPNQPYGARTYRYEPGVGQSYGNSIYYGGGQNYAPGYGAPSQAQSMTSIPRQVVEFHSSHPAGSVVIDTSERRLYYVLGNGQAIRYGIGVGREGFQWAGVHHVTTKREWPDWRPPAQMLRRQPYLPRYMPGGPNNPLGARAMYIGSTLYRIHGSNEPHTIGQAVSSGCIRMTNEDVIDLYERVRVGAKVVVQR